MNSYFQNPCLGSKMLCCCMSCICVVCDSSLFVPVYILLLFLSYTNTLGEVSKGSILDMDPLISK